MAVTFLVRCGCIQWMTMDDFELAQEYARTGSEEAFATLVSRHVNLVYSVALRHTRDRPLAEEITQSVFVIFAAKCGGLRAGTIVSAWLCRTAGYVAARALTAERRRLVREQTFMKPDDRGDEASDADVWKQIAPHLDAAMAELGEKEHSAVTLRFFEGRRFKEVSDALQTSEAGAKMRVARGLEKLRKYFGKRGITLTTSAIAAAVSGFSVQAAPAGLAKAATVAAAKGTLIGGSVSTLAKTTLKIMAWTKLKTAAVATGATILTLGMAGIVVHHHFPRTAFAIHQHFLGGACSIIRLGRAAGGVRKVSGRLHARTGGTVS
jgi:RNA polymerase sigma factor (sigma-70 family)